MSTAGRPAEPVAGAGPEVARFCTGCGSPASSCPGCRRTLDPPRFCPGCGRRLTVAVSPGGYRATCRDHGELAKHW